MSIARRLFLKNIAEHQQLVATMGALTEQVQEAVRLCAGAMRAGGKIMLCGNGGSAADSQHIAAEFTGRFAIDRRPLPALALSTDTSALTCIGNDYAYDQVFVRQIQALGKSQDCLVGISTSGNSANVVRAVEAARQMGMHTIGLLGRNGGQLAGLCNCSVIVPSDVTARIQEMHILIGHTLCGAIEQELGLVPIEE